MIPSHFWKGIDTIHSPLVLSHYPDARIAMSTYWSGGARRARPRAENRPARGRGWLGRLVLRPSVR